MPEFMNNRPMNRFRTGAGYIFGDYVYNLREIGELSPEEQDIIFNYGQSIDMMEYNRLKAQSENQNQGQTPLTATPQIGGVNFGGSLGKGAGGGGLGSFTQPQPGIGGFNFNTPVIPGQIPMQPAQTPQTPAMPQQNAIQGMANGVIANNPAVQSARMKDALTGFGKPDGTGGIWDDKSQGFLSKLWDQRSNKGEMTAGLTGIAGTIGNLLFNKPPSGESDRLLSDVTKSVTDSITESGRNLKQQFRPEYYQRAKEINAIQAAGGANRLPAGAVGNQIADTGYQHWRSYYDRLTPAIDSTVKSTTKSVTDSLGQNLANNAYTRYMANQNAFNWKQGLLGGAMNIGMNMLMPGSGLLSRGVGGILSKLF